MKKTKTRTHVHRRASQSHPPPTPGQPGDDAGSAADSASFSRSDGSGDEEGVPTDHHNSHITSVTSTRESGLEQSHAGPTKPEKSKSSPSPGRDHRGGQEEGGTGGSRSSGCSGNDEDDTDRGITNSLATTTMNSDNPVSAPVGKSRPRISPSLSVAAGSGGWRAALMAAIRVKALPGAEHGDDQPRSRRAGGSDGYRSERGGVRTSLSEYSRKNLDGGGGGGEEEGRRGEEGDEGRLVKSNGDEVRSLGGGCNDSGPLETAEKLAGGSGEEAAAPGAALAKEQDKTDDYSHQPRGDRGDKGGERCLGDCDDPHKTAKLAGSVTTPPEEALAKESDKTDFSYQVPGIRGDDGGTIPGEIGGEGGEGGREGDTVTNLRTTSVDKAAATSPRAKKRRGRGETATSRRGSGSSGGCSSSRSSADGSISSSSPKGVSRREGSGGPAAPTQQDDDSDGARIAADPPPGDHAPGSSRVKDTIAGEGEATTRSHATPKVEVEVVTETTGRGRDPKGDRGEEEEPAEGQWPGDGGVDAALRKPDFWNSLGGSGLSADELEGVLAELTEEQAEAFLRERGLLLNDRG